MAARSKRRRLAHWLLSLAAVAVLAAERERRIRASERTLGLR